MSWSPTRMEPLGYLPVDLNLSSPIGAAVNPRPVRLRLECLGQQHSSWCGCRDPETADAAADVRQVSGTLLSAQLGLNLLPHVGRKVFEAAHSASRARRRRRLLLE